MTNIPKYCVLILSVFINKSVSQNYLPCRCENKTMDCSKGKTKEVITRIPKVSTIPIEELILTGQSLGSINNKTFPNMENLKTLALQSCKLNFVHRDSFKFMPNLTEINLSHNDLVSLDKNIFRYNPKLVKIRINHNLLRIIKNGTFVGQKLLTHLFLQNNEIPNITREAFPIYSSLKVLNLTQNKLKFFDGQVIEHSEDLEEIYLDDNPFNCNCHLKPFFEALKNKDFSGINSKCSEPKALENEPLIDLFSSDFTCPMKVFSLSGQNITTYEDNATLICMVQANSEPYIMWKLNNEMIYGDDIKYSIRKQHIMEKSIFQYNLTIYNLTANDTGQYCCLAKNTGHTNQTTFNLVMEEAEMPVIIIPKKNIIFVDLHEENYTIPFKVSGVPKPTVTWAYRDKTITSNETSTSKSIYFSYSNAEKNHFWFNVTLRKVKLKYKTEFSMSASNCKGTANKSVTLIILYPHSVRFEQVQTNIQAEEMKNVSLLCGVKAVPKPDILWRYGHLGVNPSISPDKYRLKQFRDDTGTYWTKLTILKIEMTESGIYKCEANNSEEIETQRFTVFVNRSENEDCYDNVTTTALIVLSCVILTILIIVIILKCCVRYYVSKNWSSEYSFRGTGSIRLEK